MPQLLSRCNLMGQTCQTIRNQRLHPQEPARTRTCTKLAETKRNQNLLATDRQEPVDSRNWQEPELGQDKLDGTGKNQNIFATNRMDHQLARSNLSSPEVSI